MANQKNHINAYARGKDIIRSQGGIIRTSQAIKAGIHPRTLYALCENGEIEKLSRGVYRLTELAPLDNIDLITVSLRCPHAVVCLVSALSYHNFTTQIPHQISIAIRKEVEIPRIAFPPITVHRFSKTSYEAGIETHILDDLPVKIYNPEKTIADCFKFRSKIGMEVVIEALKLYKARYKFNVNKLIEHARICRVYNVMYPYLETII
jgi:predicted transcriptional regulator of viral defense system